ncbi:PadR family transcriptional regulator [Bacillus lacus]|uniref:PadR family transcriptional regulator n=1 Tax=Metabacillus lacus TaxID=1983721 RepID=A0A7X2IYP1_9BACI|nr:PadR family transcriptional regulator [Metabacillus lacus]MRX72227.1 PadR family transcriptional regulator [Metabacillus lacus]
MSMKLTILGLLMEREAHPYDMKQTMKFRHMDHYIKLQKGSLYYAVEQLLKENYIVVADIVKDSNRPDKTIYRITDSGEKHFHKLLIDQLSTKTNFFHPLSTGLAFALHGDQKQVAEMLEIRYQKELQRCKELKEIFHLYHTQVPCAVLHLMKGAILHSETETSWLKNLIKDAKLGNLKKIGEYHED